MEQYGPLSFSYFSYTHRESTVIESNFIGNTGSGILGGRENISFR
jgi:hypothetical protein